jgi:N-acetylglutamate synthase-like GNAT family acetyltransferase
MIRTAQESDAEAIACIHIKTLQNSFLALLGEGLLELIYKFLIKNELVIVYCDNLIIKGFISFSSDSSGMMKRFLYSCPLCILKLILRLFISPSLLKHFIETFSTPFKSKVARTYTGKVLIPTAELLSISIEPDYQASGVGSQLLKNLESRLNTAGVERYKVLVGVSLDSGNKFYLKNGFTMVAQIKIHGDNLSNIYVKELSKRI